MALQEGWLFRHLCLHTSIFSAFLPTPHILVPSIIVPSLVHSPEPAILVSPSVWLPAGTDKAIQGRKPRRIKLIILSSNWPKLGSYIYTRSSQHTSGVFHSYFQMFLFHSSRWFPDLFLIITRTFILFQHYIKRCVKILTGQYELNDKYPIIRV